MTMAMTHLFVLLLSLHAIAASAQEFVSIDCGSTSSSTSLYTDEIFITWIGDDSYITTGENKVVQTPNSVSEVMSTLRVFPTHKKNCYSIPFTKDTKALVRASFYYGNYDHKSSPPTFDLQLDGNYWATVDTSISTDMIYVEAIVVERSDSMSVCLAQTQPNQFPFISALEIRPMESTMYRDVDSNYALLLTRRAAFGATQNIRFSEDLYDRIWVPAGTGVNGLIPVQTTALAIITSDSADYPPSVVLGNAITTANTSTIIQLGTNLPDTDVPVYINFYFSEVDELDSTQKRSFDILLDNTTVTTTPIIPPYGSVSENNLANGTTASSKNILSLVSTTDSTLPPLINAMEVFIIAGPLTNGTDSSDVEKLQLLQTQFSVLAASTGDPCLPSPYTWDWVNCSSDATPRITDLYLGGYGLSGTLPDFSSMSELQSIDFHNNSLRGNIPSFLGDFPNLQYLNLANNDFSGTVPTSLSQNKRLKLNVSGNKKLCATNSQACSSAGTPTDNSTDSSSSSSKSSSKLPIILGVTIPVVVIFIAVVAFLAITYHKRNANALAKMNASAGQTNNGVYKPSGPPQEAPVPPPSVDVRVELEEHNMEAELSDLMDQHALQNQYDERSPNPLLNNP